MNSPYFNGGGAVNFMPPPGLAEMLSQREKDTVSELGNIGKVAGAVGGGIVGAFQGAADPGQFGAGTPAGGPDGTDWSDPGSPGTSAGSGAVQGFAHDYLHAAQGGGSGSNFADMVQGNGSGGSGGGTPNFKQIQQMGKSADAFREAARHNTTTTGQDDPVVLGKTDDEWKTMGSQDKFNTVAGAFQQQNYKAQLQAYDQGQAHLAQVLQQTKEMQDNARENDAFASAASQASQPDPLDEFDDGGALNPQSFFAAAANNPDALKSRLAIPMIQAASGRWQNRGSEEGSPTATMVTVGDHQVPVLTRGRWSQVDPTYGANLKTNSAADRESARQDALNEVPDPPEGNPGKGMHWAWKGARTGYVAEKDAAQSAADKVGELLGGSGNPAAPALRFRKNPKTGKVESY